MHPELLALVQANQADFMALLNGAPPMRSNDTVSLEPSHSLATRGAIGTRKAVCFRPVLDSHHPERNSHPRRHERHEEGGERVGVRRRAGRWV